MLSNHDALWVKLCQAKYLRGCSFVTHSPSQYSSSLWKRIVLHAPLLAAGVCRQVRDGSSTRIWSDPWVPGLDGLRPLPRDPYVVLFPLSRTWNRQAVWDAFDDLSARAIL